MFESVQINPWGCIAAGVSAFALGGLWFSPMLFSKTWADSVRASGLSLGKPQIAMPISLLGSIAASFLLAVLFSLSGFDSTGRGFLGSLVLAAIVSMYSLADSAFSSSITGRWWWIQWSHRFLAVLLMGTIIGASAPEKITVENALEKATQALEKNIEGLGK
ncbi:MAG: DUF1761 domain-containing protein [Fibrobacterota bacterium]|nr:DUF1761 domain-containing protein [Fibrobacterota bacterium]QQS03965.1 MAG: DUF1761 domain-containing protein [Fibrobacterota bacterium]